MSKQPKDGATLRRVLGVLHRRRLVLVLALVLVPATALAVSLMQEKEYSATSSLLFRDPGFDSQVSGARALPPSADPARQAETNVRLVSLDVVAERTARRVGRGLTEESVSDRVEVEPQGTSDVVEVTATDASPSRAATLANAFGREYVAFRREADRSKIRDAARLVDRRLARLTRSQRRGKRGTSLQQRADELEVLASLQTGNAELVQTAQRPKSASSPKVVQNVFIGIFVGLMLGVGLAFLLELLDRRLKDPREIGEIFGKPLLGVVPESRAILDAHRATDLPPGEAEAFRLLRANLRYFNVDQDLRTLAITSASPGEGKSTIAWNLASISALAGEHVLLIEADLRHPVVGRRYGPATPGLSQVLAGQMEMAEATHSVPVDGGRGAGAALSVIPAGPLPPNPTELIESATMRSLLGEVQATYDLVVIDTPPTSSVSDAIPLVRQVTGLIVVTRAGHTTREAATHLHRQLENLHAPLLGLVVNGVSRREEGYYGYDAAYADVPADAAALDPDSPSAEGQPTNGAGANHDAPARSPSRLLQRLRR